VEMERAWIGRPYKKYTAGSQNQYQLDVGEADALRGPRPAST
jgi:hypothetical protein